jgi:hypothetical protein
LAIAPEGRDRDARHRPPQTKKKGRRGIAPKAARNTNMGKILLGGSRRNEPEDQQVSSWLAGITLQNIRHCERQILIGMLRHDRLSDRQHDLVMAAVREGLQ